MTTVMTMMKNWKMTMMTKTMMKMMTVMRKKIMRHQLPFVPFNVVEERL